MTAMLITRIGLINFTILTFTIHFTGIAGIIHLITMVDGVCRCHLAGIGDILTMVTATDIRIMDGDTRDMGGATIHHIMVVDIIHQFM